MKPLSQRMFEGLASTAPCAFCWDKRAQKRVPSACFAFGKDPFLNNNPMYYTTRAQEIPAFFVFAPAGGFFRGACAAKIGIPMPGRGSHAGYGFSRSLVRGRAVSSSAISRSARRSPRPLSAREERARLRPSHAARATTRRAAALIEHNLRLVAHIARKYTVPGCDADDLVSIGAIGLIKAVKHLPSRTAAPRFPPTPAAASKTKSSCACAPRRSASNDVSLEEPVGSDSEGNEITPHGYARHRAGRQSRDEVDRRITLSRVRTHRPRRNSPSANGIVLEMRYGLLDGECRPQYEVAEALGISPLLRLAHRKKGDPNPGKKN